MKIGTKSILFGVHQFILHPIFTALAWWKLYGFPCDPRLWVAFFVHDLGYWGKPDMDGPAGESHPILGSRIMSVFGRNWRGFVLYHSGYYAEQHHKKISRLCVADKYAIVLVPTWLYVFLGRLSGELYEYQYQIKYIRQRSFHILTDREWFESVKVSVGKWVEEKKQNEDWYDF